MIAAKFIKKSKKRLLAEKKRLQHLLSQIGPEYPELGNKEDENAAEVVLYERNIAEERDLGKKLARIEAALVRIENGSYGICLKGGEEMTAARLEAAPEAENCIEHAQ